jgi:hypothetical protein
MREPETKTADTLAASASHPRGIGRRGVLTAFGVAGLAAASVAHPAAAESVDGALTSVDTVDDLRAISDAQPGAVYCVRHSGQAGLFYYDADDTSTSDNTGVTVVSTAGLRFKRLLDNPAVVNVQWFGATGDGETDDLAAINRTVAYLADVDLPDAMLLFPPSLGYAVSGTVTVPGGISIDMESPILYAGTANEPGLHIGGAVSDRAVVFNRRYRLRIKRTSTSDWMSEDSIGIRLVNSDTCEIDIVEARQFTIGVQCLGAGQGFSYNRVNLGYIIDNKIAVDLTNISVDGNIGWCNENVFTGGRLAVSSTTHLGESRYGVRSSSIDGSYLSNNNNVFYKPNFELGASHAKPGEALPILIEYGRLNRFESIRNEGNGPYVMRVLNDSIWNEVYTGYGFAPVDDQSLRPSSVAHSRINAVSDIRTAVFDSGPLHKRACYYDGDTQLQIPGVGCGHAADGQAHAAGKLTLTDRYIEAAGDDDAAVGVFLDTSERKRFVLKRDCESDHRGHLIFVCYDADGNVLSDPDGTWQNAHVVTAIDFTTFTWHADRFGGSYETGAETIPDFYFVVRPEVHTLRVLLWRGDSSLQLRSFAIHALDDSTAAVWTGVDELDDGSHYALKAPTTGVWPRGMFIRNAQPGAPADPANRVGGAEILLGWQKVTSGAANQLHRDWVPIQR